MPILYLYLLTIWCVITPAQADPDDHQDDDHHPYHEDHDRARAAVEAGWTRPLAEILQHVRRDYPGEIIDVELEDDHYSHHDGMTPIIYEIKIRTKDGRILRLRYDARTGVRY